MTSGSWVLFGIWNVIGAVSFWDKKAMWVTESNHLPTTSPLNCLSHHIIGGLLGICKKEEWLLSLFIVLFLLLPRACHILWIWHHTQLGGEQWATATSLHLLDLTKHPWCWVILTTESKSCVESFHTPEVSAGSRSTLSFYGLWSCMHLEPCIHWQRTKMALMLYNLKA